jgi:hypothetical protein
MWETHQDFVDMLAEEWHKGDSANSLQELKSKLSRLSVALSGWNKHTFGFVRREIAKLEKELE